MKLKKVYDYDGTPVFLEPGRYGNGRLALQLMYRGEFGYEPYMTLTVNLPAEECPDGEVFIKDYSENEGAMQWAVDNNIIEAGATASMQSGWVVIQRFKLTKEFLKELK